MCSSPARRFRVRWIHRRRGVVTFCAWDITVVTLTWLLPGVRQGAPTATDLLSRAINGSRRQLQTPGASTSAVDPPPAAPERGIDSDALHTR